MNIYNREFYVVPSESGVGKCKVLANIEECVGREIIHKINVRPSFEGKNDVLKIKTDCGLAVCVTLYEELSCSPFDGQWQHDNNWNDIREQIIAFEKATA